MFSQGKLPLQDSCQPGIVLCLQAFLFQAFKAAHFSSTGNWLNKNPCRALCCALMRQVAPALTGSYHPVMVVSLCSWPFIPFCFCSLAPFFTVSPFCHFPSHLRNSPRGLWTIAGCPAFVLLQSLWSAQITLIFV